MRRAAMVKEQMSRKPSASWRKNYADMSVMGLAAELLRIATEEQSSSDYNARRRFILNELASRTERERGE